MAEPRDPATNPEADSSMPPSEGSGSFQLPEEFQGKSLEDVVRLHLDSEKSYQQRMQELEPLIQAQKQLEPYGGVAALQDAYAQMYHQYQQMLTNQQQRQPQQQPQQQQQAQASNPRWDEDWDMLTPREQAQRIQEQVSAQTMQQMQQYGNQLYQEAMQKLTGETGTMRRELDVFRALQDVQRQHPDLDATQLLQRAVDISRSDPQQLLQLATQALANQDGKQSEVQARQLFERWKADEELKRKNEEIESITGQGGQTLLSRFPRGEDRPVDSAGIQREVIQQLLNDPNSGLTTAHFTP